MPKNLIIAILAALLGLTIGIAVLGAAGGIDPVAIWRQGVNDWRVGTDTRIDRIEARLTELEARPSMPAASPSATASASPTAAPTPSPTAVAASPQGNACPEGMARPRIGGDCFYDWPYLAARNASCVATREWTGEAWLARQAVLDANEGVRTGKALRAIREAQAAYDEAREPCRAAHRAWDREFTLRTQGLWPQPTPTPHVPAATPSPSPAPSPVPTATPTPSPAAAQPPYDDWVREFSNGDGEYSPACDAAWQPRIQAGLGLPEAEARALVDEYNRACRR